MPELLSVAAKGFADLHRELARRREDQRPRAPRRFARVVLQHLQDGQREGGGLARAGLRLRPDVASGEDRGDRARLHGRGGAVAAFIKDADQRGRETESGKGQASWMTRLDGHGKPKS
jgi:hypothetical protein